MTASWLSLLQTLCDDADEFEHDGGTVVFRRHGNECLLRVIELPGIGPAVDADGAPIPFYEYVQRELLRLPLLAAQITRAIERDYRQRKIRFVDGPAELCRDREDPRGVERVVVPLEECLHRRESLRTHVIQLMASAGEGKTVLLNELSLRSARSYHAEEHPAPLVLTVDLLGRYVGTIDDAIAGSLNNTYLFPSLTQRDVLCCLRHHWIILALDGFDELVARVGIRDAFTHLRDLVEQLGGAGTVLLSARRTFFELYSITAGIRTYLNPRRGSYVSTVVRLQPWSKTEGLFVFTALDSHQPETDFDELSGTFDDDPRIIGHPFFLTRLARAWVKKGERFRDESGERDPLRRTQFILESFVIRETNEKWVDRESREPLLSRELHFLFLGCAAEEMWRTGAYVLDSEEIRLVAELSLAEHDIPQEVVQEVIQRAPTHAAFVPQESRVRFYHDRFFHLFLGHRLAALVASKAADSVIAALNARELDPETLEWIAWFYREEIGNASECMEFLQDVARSGQLAGPGQQNLGTMCACALKLDRSDEIEVAQLTFFGDCLSVLGLSGVTFRSCKFWQIDLADANLKDCVFSECEFGDIVASQSTVFAGARFSHCEIRSIEVVGEVPRVFGPDVIMTTLRRLGATVEVQEVPGAPAPQALVAEELVNCVEHMVRASTRTCDVALAEVARRFGDAAYTVADAGVEHQILRQVERATSGRPQVFVRFTTDRERLVRGQVAPVGDRCIDGFWEALRPH